MGLIHSEPSTRANGLSVASVPRMEHRQAAVTAEDVDLFREGTHARLYRILGSHPVDEGAGARFAVWAPEAESVSVIGDFNGWSPGAAELRPRDDGSGIWEGLVVAARPGDRYKYRVQGPGGHSVAERGDPLARWWEHPPGSASRIWHHDATWTDEGWMRARADRHTEKAALAIYEVHLGSWRRVVLQEGATRFLDYREAADALADYAAELGFSHVALLPLMEHPDYASLGYRASGLFAPTARFGRPEDALGLIDRLHQRGIGVILEMNLFHCGAAADCLFGFDGATSLLDESTGESPECLYDLRRPEVRSFLLSAALYWLDVFHADGLRLDTSGIGVGSLNQEAIDSFLHELAVAVRREHPDTLGVICERGGTAEGHAALCGLAWERSWVRAIVNHLALEGYRRPPARSALSLGAVGSRVLPLCHDAVMVERGSLLERMPGDPWQQRATLRLLLGWLYACPGKKLLFMGVEIGQMQRWQPRYSLDWHLLEEAPHRGLKTWVRDLNHLYRRTPALHRDDPEPRAVSWLDTEGDGGAVGALLRQGNGPDDLLLVVVNQAPEPLRDCRVAVPKGGWWQEVLNSDAWMYGGSGQGNLGGGETDPVPAGSHYSSLLLTLPPLGMIFLQYQGQGPAEGRP